MNIDAHRARMLANGDNIGDSLGKSTKDGINNSFKDSPFYELVTIGGVETDVTVVGENVGENIESLSKKYLTLRPHTKPNIGSIVNYDNSDWVVVDFNRNDIFPLITIRLCNSTFTIKGETTQTPTGETNYRGEPLYATTYGENILIPCIAEDKFYMGDNDQPIRLAGGRLLVTLPYSNNESFEMGKTFTMYDTNYKIMGVDKTKMINGVGLIILTGERSN